MIGRSNRFHGYSSLQAVYRRGETVRGPMLSLKYYSQGTTRPFRVGVVIGKKVSKSAVTRNRIRRRIFELMRTQLGSNANGYDLVVTGFDEQLANIDHEELQNTVKDLLKKANLI